MHMVQVQLIERAGERVGPRYRAGILFQPGTSEIGISTEQLAELKTDPWFRIRELNELDSAVKAAALEQAVRIEVMAARENLAALEAKLELVSAESNAKAAAATGYSPEVIPPAATPFQDAIRAATPGNGTMDATKAALPESVKSALGMVDAPGPKKAQAKK